MISLLKPLIDGDTVWKTFEHKVVLLWGWRICLSPQHSLFYIIVSNKLRNAIWRVCIPGRRGVEGALKNVCAKPNF
jgi:hypothetical protein